jgi:hypothetical protein
MEELMTKRKELESQLEFALKERGLTYGHKKGEYNLTYTDQRCAPYLYAVEKVVNDGGGVTRISHAMTAEQAFSWICGFNFHPEYMTN